MSEPTPTPSNVWKENLVEMRLGLIAYAKDHSLDELLTRALDDIGELVQSPIGFYHFVEADQKTITLQQWSTRTLNEFCQAAGKGSHYPIDVAGVWTDCVRERATVIHNDYASLPHKRGMPPGHATVVRELVTPVMRDGQVVAILGVGNKPMDYTADDAEIVAYIADVTWELVRSKQVEEALRERQIMEASLRQSEARWRAMIQGMPDLLFRLSADGTYLDYYAPDDDLLLVPPEVFLGQKVMDVLPHHLSRRQMEAIRQALRTGEVTYLRFEAPAMGMMRRFEARFVPVGTDEVLVVSRDMTELWQTQRELEEARLRLEFSVDSARIAWWEIAVDTGKMTSHPLRALMLGHEPDDFANATYQIFVDLIHRDDRPAVTANMRDLLEGRSDLYAVDYRIKTAVGDWLWFHDRGQLVQTEMGDQLVRGFVIDISERKRLEEQEILIALEKERRGLLAKFIQNAAHEFKTPLSVISLNTHLITHFRDADPDRQQEKVEQIEKQVWRMNRLVDMLLQMTRLDGVQKVEEDVLDIADLLDALGMRAEDRVNGRLTIRYLYPPDLPLVVGDAALLREALWQLLDNAIRFTPTAGQITIRASSEPPNVVIWVEDTGEGITEGERPFIFDTFWRRDQAHTVPGFGLGLPIAREIIQLHGGELTLENDQEQGCTFRVTLPAAS
jgi:PAS domain S-box-containing protein